MIAPLLRVVRILLGLVAVVGLAALVTLLVDRVHAATRQPTRPAPLSELLGPAALRERAQAAALAAFAPRLAGLPARVAAILRSTHLLVVAFDAGSPADALGERKLVITAKGMDLVAFTDVWREALGTWPDDRTLVALEPGAGPGGMFLRLSGLELQRDLQRIKFEIDRLDRSMQVEVDGKDLLWRVRPRLTPIEVASVAMREFLPGYSEPLWRQIAPLDVAAAEAHVAHLYRDRLQPGDCLPLLMLILQLALLHCLLVLRKETRRFCDFLPEGSAAVGAGIVFCGAVVLPAAVWIAELSRPSQLAMLRVPLWTWLGISVVTGWMSFAVNQRLATAFQRLAAH